jgi:hypothetical protein
MKQPLAYETLALELIDNDFDSVGLRARTGGSVPGLLTPTSDIEPHVTLTGKMRSDKEGRERSPQARRNCVICGDRAPKACSSSREGRLGEVFVCDFSKGRVCYLSLAHPEHG